MAGCMTLDVGLTTISTPIKPIMMAAHWPNRKGCLSHQWLMTATMSGEENKMDAVSVNCKYCSDQKLMEVMTPNMMARTTCNFILFIFKSPIL